MEKASESKLLEKEIIEKRKNKMKEQYSTLAEGIYIHEDIITFERGDVLDVFSLMLPTSFDIMSEEIKNIKYTSKYAPPYLLSNEDFSIDLGFNIFADRTPKIPVLHLAQDIKGTLEKDQSTYDFQDMTSLQKVDGYCFDFFQTTLDTDLFHLMAFVRISGQIMQLTFNCVSELDIVTWKSIVVQMLESIEKYEKKER